MILFNFIFKNYDLPLNQEVRVFLRHKRLDKLNFNHNIRSCFLILLKQNQHGDLLIAAHFEISYSDFLT